jgi:hypothetical protein
MVSRGKAAKYAKKTSMRKPRAVSPSPNDLDPDFNIDIESDSGVVIQRRQRRGARPSLSKTTDSCVTQPCVKVTRSMKADAQVRKSDLSVILSSQHQTQKLKEPEEVPYWQRRRPLNPYFSYQEPTAKQAADAAADWKEGQKDPRYPEFQLYDLVIQEPTANEIIIRLSEEPHRRLGDLQFLLQTRYEDSIDEARDCHEVLFVFKYDMPPDKGRQYPQSAAVRDGQIRVARVWALSEVINRPSAREKCWRDEAMLLKLVVRQAALAGVSLEEWKEEMELTQLHPGYIDPRKIDLKNGPASPDTNLAVAGADQISVRDKAAIVSVPGAKRSAPIDIDALENEIRPTTKKVQIATKLSLPALTSQPISTMSSKVSLASSPAVHASPATLMGPPQRPTVVPKSSLASTEPGSGQKLQVSSSKALTEAEVAHITTQFCTKSNAEVQKHFVSCSKYIISALQPSIRRFVTISVPASQKYTKEQWQEIMRSHLTFQQKRFERKWCEDHPGNTFKSSSPDPFVRQLSYYLANYLTRYPGAEDVPDSQAQKHRLALQQAAMRKQRGLLISWTQYWEGATQMVRNKKIEPEVDSKQKAVSAPPAPSVTGSQAAPVEIRDYRMPGPAVVVAKRKRTDGDEPTRTEHMRPTKKTRVADNEDAMIDPRLRDIAERAS